MLKKMLLTVVMCLGIFLVMLDTTIMNIALPAIKLGLGVSIDKLSWALNVYTIIFATFTIPLSRVADLFGRGKVFIIGLFLFGIGSLIAGFSIHFIQLIIGRVISSFGAAILLPIGNALGISIWSIKDRFKVVAILGLTQGGAATIGPTLGGLLTDNLSWNWIFFINLPFIIVAILMLILTYNFKTEKVFAVKIDWFGSLISMCCLLSAVLSIVKVKDWGVSDWKTVVCVLSAFMAGVGFIHIEKRSSYPMIDLRLFSIKVFTTSTVLAFIVQFFYIGVIVILPIFLTNVQGKTEFMAALMLLPMSITVFIFGGMGSLLINKLGPRLLVFIGLTFILFSYSLLTYINPKNNLLMILSILCLGIGFGTIAGPINVLSASNLRNEALTISQSIISVVRQIGSIFGVSVFMSILTTHLKHLAIIDYTHILQVYQLIYQIWIIPLVVILSLSFVFPKKSDYLRKSLTVLKPH